MFICEGPGNSQNNSPDWKRALDEQSRCAAVGHGAAVACTYRAALHACALEDAVCDPHEPVNLHTATAQVENFLVDQQIALDIWSIRERLLRGLKGRAHCGMKHEAHARTRG